MADHPLAQKVGAFREKAHSERELLALENVSSTILRMATFMETLDMMLQGPAAFVPGRQRPVSWITARAAVRIFQADILVCHELAGPEPPPSTTHLSASEGTVERGYGCSTCP